MPEENLPNQENQNLASQGQVALEPDQIPPASQQGPTLQNTVVKNEKPSGKSPVLKYILIGVIAALIIAGLAGAYVLGAQKSNNQITENPTPMISPSEDSTVNWTTYSDEEFNLSFKYPSEFGEVILSPGPEGRLLKFKNNDGLLLGVYIKPATPDGGRGGTVLDFSGYTETNGKYYFNDWMNPSKEEVIPIKIIEVDGKKILILNNDSFTLSKDAYGGYGQIGANSTIALINLGNERFQGIVFNNGADDKKQIPQEQFEQILSTFKFTDSNTQSTTQNYLNIPELGIKIPLDDSIKDLIYYPETVQGKTIAYLSTTTLAKDGGQYCSAKESPSGIISIVKKNGLKDNPDDPWWSRLSGLKEATISDPIQAKEYPDFFILYTSPQATCSDKQNVISLQSSSIKAITQAIPNIQLIK